SGFFFRFPPQPQKGTKKAGKNGTPFELLLLYNIGVRRRDVQVERSKVLSDREFAEKMLAYFREAGDDKGRYPGEVPSFVRFCCRMGTDTADLERRRRKSPGLDRTYRFCREILSDKLVDGALHKRLDPSFTKFLLTSCFGFSEKEDNSAEPFSLSIQVKDPDAP
ncbi:MAG: DNA-packaging protein, partial [Clostridia bacterium]|nr:DNA-packaging protein [Clostridia bacterium]